jgi:hypothetical protein
VNRVEMSATVPDAAVVCEVFDLGRPQGPLVFAARGELGRVHRLATDRGVWAVKELLGDVDPPEHLADNAAFQAAVRAGPGVASHELASALHEFTGDDLSVARAMRRAYGGDVDVTVESFATALAFEANLLEFYARRWVASPAASEDRARSAWRLAQMTSNPLTVERAERLAAAAR